MQIIGFDPGNSESTLAWRVGAVQRHATIPSFIGSGRLEELQRVRSAAGYGALQKDELVLHFAGVPSFVGKLAIEESRDASAARNDVSRYWNGHTLRLLLTLSAQANLSGPVRVMTGLPVSAWTAENKKAVQKALCGTHVYAVNGKERMLTIEAVGVMMEGAAALASYEAPPNIPQAVIDVGGRTTDLFWSVGVRPVARLCDAEEIGVEKAGDLLRQGTLSTHKRELNPHEIRDTLRAYVSDEIAPRIFKDGKEIVLNGAVGAAIDAVAQQLLSYVARLWGDDRGAVAGEAARVLLIGGGAYYFGEALKQSIPHLETSRHPELANAFGYLAVGSAASEEAWARNRGQ